MRLILEMTLFDVYIDDRLETENSVIAGHLVGNKEESLRRL